MNLYSNPHIFFLIQESKIILWDYEAHLQYELSEDEFFLLKNYQQNLGSPKLKTFIDANILSYEPYKKLNWAWDELSKIFFIGTRNIIPLNNDNARDFSKSYIQGCKDLEINLDQKSYKNIITLPKANLDLISNKQYLNVLLSRMTSRVFKEDMYVSLNELSLFLFLSFGYVHGEWDEFSKKGFKKLTFRKTTPAAGGLHHCEAYILVYNVEGLDAAIYKYIPEKHGLYKCSEIIFHRELIEILSGQFFIKNICFGVFITANLEKLMNKYHHSEVLRSAYVDVGALVQTAQLNSAVLGLESFITGAFHEESICKILNIVDIKKSPLFFIGIGYGARQAIPDEFVKVIDDVKSQ